MAALLRAALVFLAAFGAVILARVLYLQVRRLRRLHKWRRDMAEIESESNWWGKR